MSNAEVLEPSDDGYICARCHVEYSLCDECVPSKYCNRCVHDVVEELEAELGALRGLDGCHCYGCASHLSTCPFYEMPEKTTG